jgi:hypothetical protein
MLHQQTQTPPAAPPAPTVPANLGQNLGQNLGGMINGIVNNALQSAGAAVQGELASAIARRDAIQAQLDAATSGSQRRSLQSKLDRANQEVEKLNRAVDQLQGGEAKLASRVAPQTHGGFGTSTAPPFNPPDEVPTTMIITVVGIIFIGFPIAIAFARLLWKRATSVGAAAAAPQQMSVDQTHRFDRLEQAVDAVAIEIERISENQRYLTKVLAEGAEKKIAG